jgi:hypothetical protein
MGKIVEIIVRDGLMFPSGFVAPAPRPCALYARVPSEWTADGRLKEEKYELFFRRLYGGPDWRDGNSDGSQYVVHEAASRVLSEAEEAAPPWLEESNEREFSRWFYLVSESGEITKTEAAEFSVLPPPDGSAG